ncbi:MAG: DUF2975 domain-containing protein [Clostridia bacterium]|nr:DUF2975 domain-containing protein [Clostridia bacterium]
MSQKKIARWLKVMLVVMGLLAFGILSALSLIFLVSEVEEIHAIQVPWLAFIWTTAVPLIPALLYSWFTVSDVGKGKAFCFDNARRLHGISLCAAADAAWVFIGNAIMLFGRPGMSHPIVFILSMVVVCIGISIAICAEGLSQLIKNAAALQEQSDLTI